MTDLMDVRRATIKARILAGLYIFQHNRAAFNQTADTTCALYKTEEEDVAHFLITCPTLSSVRDPVLTTVIGKVSLV